MKRWQIALICLIAWSIPLLMSAWDNTLPADSTEWNDAAGYIRNNWDAIEGVLGVDLADIDCGTDGSDRGHITLWDGSGGHAAGYIKIHSEDGTAYYLFVEDDMTLKIHTGVPSADTDGTVVGSQS